MAPPTNRFNPHRLLRKWNKSRKSSPACFNVRTRLSKTWIGQMSKILWFKTKVQRDIMKIKLLNSRFTSLHGKLALECQTTNVSVVKTIRLHR